ncbi:uncharacterized protein G2W53_033840 [Senna tora]|uniref:Uncharacterized protein n=1 Tax=Senna tora TaxID=362788 RepID=A0A834TA49_9FABA|nr:uncharacterized protein G2W53_033840 [Senna tora]
MAKASLHRLGWQRPCHMTCHVIAFTI